MINAWRLRNRRYTSCRVTPAAAATAASWTPCTPWRLMISPATRIRSRRRASDVSRRRPLLGGTLPLRAPLFLG
jgi:hypothetical protein